MQNPNNLQGDDYAKKLYEMEKAKQQSKAEGYNSFVKAVKWVLIGALVFIFGGAFLSFIFAPR